LNSASPACGQLSGVLGLSLGFGDRIAINVEPTHRRNSGAVSGSSWAKHLHVAR